MKAATAKQIKDELNDVSPIFLKESILRLSRFKKENKELLTYMLFYKNEEEEYVKDIKEELNNLFKDLNLTGAYFAKKGLRKILRIVAKYCRYTNSESTPLEVYVHLGQIMQTLPATLKKNKQISNMYEGTLKKINAFINVLHADLQFDYHNILKQLEVKF